MESASVQISGTAAITDNREGIGEHKKALATLKYDQARPLQLEITVVERGIPNVWMVSRDLVQAGCFLTTGIGDVVVSTRGNAVGITFIANTEYEGTLWLRKTTLQTFLDDTYCVVPAGEESKHMDWDAALKDLLNAD